MTPWVYAATIAAAATAAVAAAADGAALAAERVVSTAADVPGASNGDTRAERERERRTLAFARITAQLVVGVGLGSIVRAYGTTPAGILIAGIVALAFVLTCETGARAWGDVHSAAMIRHVRPLVRILSVALAPVMALASALDRATTAALPAAAQFEEERELAAAQFREVVAAEAEVTHDEAALLHGVFSLGDTEVHEVMVPRVNIVGVEATMPWSEVVDRVRSSEHSRFPAYEDTLDDILGVLYAKDLLPAILADAEPEDGWRSLIRPASFVPRTKTIGDQLRDFRADRQHLALVADEFGGIAGLVTIEDVLEEIVGEIRDEYDEEEPEFVAEGGRRYWVAGRFTLEELSEELAYDMQRDGITTVGGLVYDELGRVPRPGESFTVGPFRVVVERVVRRKVERVYFERQPEERDPEAEPRA